MDLKAQLEDRNLKWNWDKIADYLVLNPSLIPDLLEFMFNGELHQRKNAAAVFGKICDRQKSLLDPYLIPLGQHLRTNPIDASKRSIIRLFQFCEIPEEIEGELFDQIIEYLKSSEEAIAIKAFGMTVARRICQKYSELAVELIPRIEILVEEKVSAGIVNRGRKELKLLQKLQ